MNNNAEKMKYNKSQKQKINLKNSRLYMYKMDKKILKINYKKKTVKRKILQTILSHNN